MHSTQIDLLFDVTVSIQISCNEVMKAGMKIYVPVSVAETKISKRYDTIPSATLYPNADEIEYLQRLVMYKVCFIFLTWSSFLKCLFLPLLGDLKSC